MKKFLLTLLTVVCTVSSWAQDPDWSVTSFSGSISNNSTTINEATWTLSDMTVGSNTNGEPAWAVSSNKWKFGNGGKQFWSSYTLSTSKFDSFNITKVEIGCYDNGNTTSSITVKQGDITIGTSSVSTTSASNSETLNTTSGAGGTLKIIFTSTKQASYITSIKVWYSLGGDAVHVESVTLDQHNITIMETKKATLTATISPANATNKNVSWSSDNEKVVTVNGGEIKGLKEGTATITVKTADGQFTDQCVVTVTPKARPSGAVFYESFDQMNGNGGNDDIWGGITQTPALGTFDNTGWTTEGLLYSGAQCVSIRKSTANTGGTDKPSGVTTPEIGTAGDGHVTFNAQSWTGDTQDFYVDIVGEGSFESASGVSLTNNNKTAKVGLSKKSEWDDFDLSFTGLASNSKFRFYMAKAKRGFLDEVAVFIKKHEQTIGSCGWSSMYLDFATVIPEGVTAYYAASVENEVITLKSVNAGEVLPANTGVLVNGTSCTFTESKSTETADVTGNLFEGVTVDTECAARSVWVLNASTSIPEIPVLSLYTGTSLGANKAYLPASKVSGAKALRLVVDENVTTGISAVSNTSVNAVAYNLAGQRVAANAKGIVIINGKKYLNK